MSFRGIVGLPDLEYSTLGASRRWQHSEAEPERPRPTSSSASDGAVASATTTQPLPAFLQILNLLLLQRQDGGLLSNVAALHDMAFSPKCPMLGTGHHFAVYASPFDESDSGFRPSDVERAFNDQVYCLKAPNFTSGEHNTSSAAKQAFRDEYYATVLQELRVLLHPQLRGHDNIINLFGFDFQADYDDFDIAWPVLIVEYAEFGTFDTLQQDLALDPTLTRVLLLDVARGIRALHQCNIIHGDVKSENVLICRHKARNYIARLSDFGLSVVNPDATDGGKLRLPGGTFLWRAPEFDQDLSVSGLRQTDVYSFGLMVWRVLVNNPNPFVLIPPAALGLPAAPTTTINESVRRAKSHPNFPQLVLQTLPVNGKSPTYAHHVVESTLGTDPGSRDLGKVLSALSSLAADQEQAPPELETDDDYWAMEEPSWIIDQLVEACPGRILPFGLKASVLTSLLSALETVFNSSSEIAPQAGWLLFQFASGPLFQVGEKDVDQCCRILLRLCHLESIVGQAIIACYYILYEKDTADIDLKWLEIAALSGSFFAMEGLRELDPERYLRLIQGPLDFEPRSADLEQNEAALLNCCRQGDYQGCKDLLLDGASAYPSQEESVSALHWLVSFHDEREINDLLGALLGNGAVLHAWEGDGDWFDFGRVTGTPLHWAVWHRNIPAIRALTRVDNNNPDVKHVDRAIWIAAVMHFYDVLEILRDWILTLKDSSPSGYDWQAALTAAADHSASWLPRRLRHGIHEPPQAVERTMETILAMYQPLDEEIKLITAFATQGNQPVLLRYLYKRLNLGNRKDLFISPTADAALMILGLGAFGVFEVLIEKGLISSKSDHGNEKFTTLQLCCITRQRDLVFAKRLLEIGCTVDGVGSTEKSQWTPFFIAVTLGMYDIAVMLLERGADKDHLSGWVGGTTTTMSLLQTWPDIPLSRLKFLLEDVPRLGFGHVTFWGWPGAGGNLLYSLSLSHWASYSAGYRIGQTAKYILSQLEDKSCLNIIDKVGATALRMACASGNVEIIQALIEAGQDVNLALGFTPLRNAKDWLATCQTREREALKGKPGPERRLAIQLRVRAETTVQLLVAHGAVDRGLWDSVSQTSQYIASGQGQRPGYEVIPQILSYINILCFC